MSAVKDLQCESCGGTTSVTRNGLLVCSDCLQGKAEVRLMVRHPDGEIARVVPPPPGVYEGAWIGMFVSFSAYGNRFRVKMSETSIDGMRKCTVTVSQGVIRVR